MHSITVWRNAKGPNYSTNVDKVFPYSEVPYLGEYNLVKIPVSLNNLILHVDYWGEGRIVSGDGTSGFTNCYNVNHQYQLVSSGADRDRKIPNRIPVSSYTDCDTSAYIKDNSAITVTVTDPSHINPSCAKDIARIVNSDHGKVVVYGISDSQDILILASELEKKGLFACPGAALPEDLLGLTLFNNHVAFLNRLDSKNFLHDSIVGFNFDRATTMTRSLANVEGGEIIRETVTKLISTAPRTAMSYAYKLWQSTPPLKDVVRQHFPKSLQDILSEDAVTIVNKQFRQPLKLDVNTDSYNDRLAWGDNACDRSSKRVSWKLIPVWSSDGVTYKLYNIDCNMYLKLDVNVDNIGDRKAWGSYNSDEVRHRYYLEPVLKNGILVFFIINCQYQQGLKLDWNVDRYGDRLLWGHSSGVDREADRFSWVIQAW